MQTTLKPLIGRPITVVRFVLRGLIFLIILAHSEAETVPVLTNPPSIFANFLNDLKIPYFAALIKRYEARKNT